MIATLLLAALLAAAADAQDLPPVTPGEEVEPLEAAQDEARARERQERRAFGGPGATPVQTLGVRASEVPDRTPLYEPPRVRPYEMPASLAASLSPWSPPPEPPREPVTLDAYARSYEGPPDPLDLRFQAGMQGALATAAAQLGPLDGSWTLSSEDGRPLYAFVLADPAPGGGVQGAWRSLTGPEAARASGVIGVAAREGDSLVASFVLPDRAEPVSLRLEPGAAGWRGVLTDPGGGQRRVVLRPS